MRGIRGAAPDLAFQVQAHARQGRALSQGSHCRVRSTSFGRIQRRSALKLRRPVGQWRGHGVPHDERENPTRLSRDRMAVAQRITAHPLLEDALPFTTCRPAQVVHTHPHPCMCQRAQNMSPDGPSSGRRADVLRTCRTRPRKRCSPGRSVRPRHTSAQHYPRRPPPRVWRHRRAPLRRHQSETPHA